MVVYPALWRRYAASVIFSAATTFALLLLMNDLISQPGPELKEPPPPWIPDVYRLPEEYEPPPPPPPVPPDRLDPPPVTKVLQAIVGLRSVSAGAGLEPQPGCQAAPSSWTRGASLGETPGPL